MKKIINAAVCDVRGATEQSFEGFDRVVINSSVLVTGKSARSVMERYPVTVNAASVIDVPEGQNIRVQTVNGRGEIGPDNDGTGVYLIVNGKLIVADGAVEAAKSYTGITVNGKLLMPKSGRGQLMNLTINGKAEYYPDGAQLLKAGTAIDSLFVLRAGAKSYYCPGDMYLLDGGIDTDKLVSEGIRFAAWRALIARSLVGKLVPLFDEETELVLMPDGVRLINDDVELKDRVIAKYGTKLCVTGDVTIREEAPLKRLEYLFACGTVSVLRDLKEAFEDVESVCGELRIVDPGKGMICDRGLVRIGRVMLDRYPAGIGVEDCAKVVLSEELTNGDIMDKLMITHCAVVYCTKEQEEAVHMIAWDVAVIRTGGQDKAAGADDDEDDEDQDGGIPGGKKDAQVINAAEYRL